MLFAANPTDLVLARGHKTVTLVGVAHCFIVQHNTRRGPDRGNTPELSKHFGIVRALDPALYLRLVSGWDARTNIELSIYSGWSPQKHPGPVVPTPPNTPSR